VATRRVAGAVPPDVSASLTMNICHISLFPSVGTLSVQYTVSFVVDGRFSADRNLQHHIEPSENRSIGETQGVDVDVSPLPPPLFPPAVPGGCLRSSSQPRASFYFSLLALLRPRLGGIEFSVPGTCPTNAIIFSQVKGCRLIGVCSLGRTSSQPFEMILKKEPGSFAYCVTPLYAHRLRN